MSKETQNNTPVSVEPVVTLNGAQLLQALDFIAPDRDTDPQQLECELTISFADGPAGSGYYCYCTDYPDEGAIMLDAEAPAAPVADQSDLTQQTLDDVMAGIPARDAEIEALRKEIEALQAALAQPQRLIFPTMLRKMWSGSEVQAWLDEELAKLTKLSSQQVTDKTDAGQGYNDGFSDGVILALQLMTMHGDYNGTQYCELFNAAGPNQIVERAIREGMWEMSGLSQTPAAVERRAAIEAARKENSNA